VVGGGVRKWRRGGGGGGGGGGTVKKNGEKKFGLGGGGGGRGGSKVDPDLGLQIFTPSLARSLTAKKTQYLTNVFITPKFFTFNAAEFKNFAVTLSSSMKRIGGSSFLVVFHPEYVGGEFEERRAPFPMVAVCREIKEE